MFPGLWTVPVAAAWWSVSKQPRWHGWAPNPSRDDSPRVPWDSRCQAGAPGPPGDWAAAAAPGGPHGSLPDIWCFVCVSSRPARPGLPSISTPMQSVNVAADIGKAPLVWKSSWFWYFDLSNLNVLGLSMVCVLRKFVLFSHRRFVFSCFFSTAEGGQLYPDPICNAVLRVAKRPTRPQGPSCPLSWAPCWSKGKSESNTWLLMAFNHPLISFSGDIYYNTASKANSFSLYLLHLPFNI